MRSQAEHTSREALKKRANKKIKDTKTAVCCFPYLFTGFFYRQLLVSLLFLRIGRATTTLKKTREKIREAAYCSS